ncbi:MAG: Gfo/Idh/MocA family oxidoreductase [Verrucomicrobiota bacterium]
MKTFLIFWSFLLALSAQSFSAELRIGMIGLDTSHCIEFTRRFNDANDKNYIPGGKVVAAFKGGSKDIEGSWSRVEGYTKQLQETYGVKIVDTIEELCEQVDVVMLESVDGRPHLQQAIPVFKAKKPIFIDKPLAGSLADAIQIFRLAKESNVPCFSASSLRYYPGLVELKNANVGEIKGAISTGPAHLEPHHPDLFWYGIHPTESLFTIMGTGCESVVRTSTPDTDVVTGVWKGGKVGTLRGLRNGVEPYRVTLFGSKAVLDQKPGGDYTPFLREVMKFFQTGVAPVSSEETIEIFAFMEAADESKRQGGSTVKISDVMKKAEAEIKSKP